MKGDPRPLLALQAIDLEIVRHQELLAENASGQQEIMRQAAAEQQKLLAVEQQMERFRSEVSRHEQALKNHEEAKSKLLKQSATIKKNDEYQVAMAQIAELDRVISKGEEAVLLAMEQVEKHQKVLDETRSSHDQFKAATAVRIREAQAEHARLEQELGELQTQRTTAATAVEPELLRRYEAVRASRTHSKRLPALVSVDGGVCARCHRQIPNKHCEEARHGEIATCEGCAALLYSEAALQ
jgi:predicted  nucleic acid-binding Zn-ribbon protein